MDTEFKENNQVREYLEKSYRTIYDQLDNKQQYYENDNVDEENEKRIDTKSVLESLEKQSMKVKTVDSTGI